MSRKRSRTPRQTITDDGRSPGLTVDHVEEIAKVPPRAVRKLKRKLRPATLGSALAVIPQDGEILPPLPNKGGRPRALPGPEDDEVAFTAILEILMRLGAIMATSKECAVMLGVSEPTLFAFFERYPEAHDTWERGKFFGRQSLRRKQFKLAEGNATMAIFLGMNYLDQKDMRQGSTNNVQANANVTIIEFGKNEGKV